VVRDIKFDGNNGSRFQMFVNCRNPKSAYISDFDFWKLEYARNTIISRLIAALSHETLHSSLRRKIGRSACCEIDQINRLAGGLIDYTGLPAGCCLEEIGRLWDRKRNPVQEPLTVEQEIRPIP